MRFRTKLGRMVNTNQTIFYRHDGFAFDTVPVPLSANVSIIIDDLSLDFDDNNRLISIWGMCPHSRWKDATLTPPKAREGEIFISSNLPLGPDIPVRLTKPGDHLSTYFDSNNGWVLIRKTSGSSLSIKVFPGAIIEIDEHDRMAAIWLQPVFE